MQQPKTSGNVFATLTSTTSSARNTKDTYTPSAPATPRNTYLPPSKELQNTGLQSTINELSQAQFVRSNFVMPDSFEVPTHVFEDRHIYWTPDGKMTAAQYAEYTPRETVLADAWTLPTYNFCEFANDSQAFTDEIRELHIDYDDETGVMILRDRDGNIITGEQKERPIWHLLGNPNNKQEFYERLEANPGLVWRFDNEWSNKDFEGHDILNAIFPKMYDNVTSLTSILDEYGYTFNVPAFSPSACFTIWSHMVWDDGGWRPQDQIYSKQQRGFEYLTLEEHDVLYAEIQKVFNSHGVRLNAREEHYTFTPAQPKDMPRPTVGCDGRPLPADYEWEPFPGGWIWVGYNSGIDQQTIKNIEKDMLANSTIRSLFEKADNVRNGVIADDTLAQQYFLRVTDDEGNRLANDRIIVEARNGNQIEMSVEQFSQMSRLEITKLLR